MGKRRSRDGNESSGTADPPVTTPVPSRGMVDRVAQFGRRGRGETGEADPFEDWVDLPAYRPSFGALLVRAGIASDRDVKEALAEGLRTGERLGEVVIRRGWATDERIAQILAEQWQLPFKQADEVAVDSAALQRVPLAVARELGALPIGLDGAGVVLAVADPSEDLFSAVKRRVGDASFVVVAGSVLEPLMDTPAPPAVAGTVATFEPEELEPFVAEPVVAAFEHETFANEAVELALPSVDAEAPPVEAAPQHHATRHLAPRHLGASTAGVSGGTPAAAAIASIAAAAAELARARSEVEAVGESLTLAQIQIGVYESALAVAAETQDRDAATIRRLEAELARRGDLFESLKAQIATLTETLETSVDGERSDPEPPSFG